MEGRTHSSKTYAVAGQVSRMASDLEECSEDFQSSYKPRPSIRQRARNESSTTSSIPRVCIIGAGLAGLRCAQVLRQADIVVTVFEARDRIGGRVCQENLNGSLVDMGPNWVHGTESNPIVKLTGETKTKIKSLGEECIYFGTDGEPVDGDKIERLDELIWEIIGEAFAYSNKRCADIPPELSLKDWFEEKLPERGLSEEDNALVMQMGQLWGSFIGDSWDKQSLKWFWLEECLDGENLYVVDSHKAIIDKIAQDLTPSIKLNVQVTRLESSQGEDKDPSQQVTTISNGVEQAHEFDEVIVAIPMGCLKREAITFSPPLPDKIRTTIVNASISSLEKVYLAFPEAFWDRIPTATTNGEKELQSPLPGFANFLNPTAYAPADQHDYALELNPLSDPDIFGPHAQPALLFSLFGACGKDLTSLLSNLSSSSPAYLQTITSFLEPYYSRLPNYNPSDPACTPTAALATDWQHDPFAYGSYTNFKVHSPERKVELDEEVRIMRRGLPERGVWFAGEHVAPFVGLGTSTGAHWSGEMVGMRVLGAWGLAEGMGEGE